MTDFIKFPHLHRRGNHQGIICGEPITEPKGGNRGSGEITIYFAIWFDENEWGEFTEEMKKKHPPFVPFCKFGISHLSRNFAYKAHKKGLEPCSMDELLEEAWKHKELRMVFRRIRLREKRIDVLKRGTENFGEADYVKKAGNTKATSDKKTSSRKVAAKSVHKDTRRGIPGRRGT
jgi:hypothetical protein